MKKNTDAKKFILLILSITVLLTLFIATFRQFHGKPNDYNTITLDTNWNVSYNGSSYYMDADLQDLSNEISRSFHRSDMLYMVNSTPLPDLKCPYPNLSIKVEDAVYQVFLDDQLIGTNAQFWDNDTYIGKSYAFIPLPSNYAGKCISIRIFYKDNTYSSNLVYPKVGNYDDLMNYLMTSSLFAVSMGVMLSVFGIVFMIISMVFTLRYQSGSVQFICSIICINVGIWILCAIDFMSMYLAPSICSSLEYVTIYSIAPLGYALVYYIHNGIKNRVYLIFGYSTSILYICLILMHIAGVSHLAQFKGIYGIVCFFALLILFVFDYIDFCKKKLNYSVLCTMFGMTCLTFSLVISALYMILTHSSEYRNNIIGQYSAPIGALIFVISILMNYFLFITNTFAKDKEFAYLSKLAYADALTGLPNRASCDVQFSTLELSSSDFCIISMDLNGLKEVNDNDGHPAGDKLLKGFSLVLKEVFASKAFISRVGGDEFIAIILTDSEDYVKDLLASVDQKLDELDEKEPDINHSFARGYAFRHEDLKADVHSIYMLADQRMYANKRSMHSAISNINTIS